MIRATLSCACVVAVSVVSNIPARADKPINLEARFAQGVMKGGEKQRNYLRVGLNGCERPPAERTPVNVAFVIDRSGSMQGTRIAQAREAAAAAIRRLDKNDIASVVVFDDKIDLLVQAQPVDDHAAFIDRIRQITARGSTAIHGGVIEGAQQVRHNFDRRRLNRVVLLSDGQANVGPRRPEDFAKLGRELLQQGISVSTIGLGLQYNEDLMLQLARASDGNHSFVGETTDLIQVFNKEFDDVLASCAQTVSIDVELRPGVRVVRALSRDGKIEGQTAQFQLNQVYAATEHYVLMEVEVDPERIRRRNRQRHRAWARARKLHRRAGRRPPDHRDAGPRAVQHVRHGNRGEPRQCGNRVGDRTERARTHRIRNRAARSGAARRGPGAIPAERQGDRGASRPGAAVGPPAISQSAISRHRRRAAGIADRPIRPAQVPAADGLRTRLRGARATEQRPRRRRT